MRQDDYRHYRAVEKRLYNHKRDEARMAVLLAERKEILANMDVKAPIFGYKEMIGRTSDGLTPTEQGAESQVSKSNRLWDINREVDILEVRNHILDYALATLTNKERDIVRTRYFDGKTIEETAVICCYSIMQCSRIRYGAIRKIGAVLFGE